MLFHVISILIHEFYIYLILLNAQRWFSQLWFLSHKIHSPVWERGRCKFTILFGSGEDAEDQDPRWEDALEPAACDQMTCQLHKSCLIFPNSAPAKW